MSINLDEHAGELIIEGEHCPNCNSTATEFDPVFGFWFCEDCSSAWTQDDKAAMDVCSTCGGTGVNGTEGGDPDVGEFYTDQTCLTCGGSGYLGGDRS